MITLAIREHKLNFEMIEERIGAALPIKDDSWREISKTIPSL
jgi:hypothetical protein